MLIKANQQKISDGSPVVSLDGMDSSSIRSTDLTTTPSSTSSPEPYPAATNHSRPPLTGVLYANTYYFANSNNVMLFYMQTEVDELFHSLIMAKVTYVCAAGLRS